MDQQHQLTHASQNVAKPKSINEAITLDKLCQSCSSSYLYESANGNARDQKDGTYNMAERRIDHKASADAREIEEYNRRLREGFLKTLGN